MRVMLMASMVGIARHILELQSADMDKHGGQSQHQLLRLVGIQPCFALVVQWQLMDHTKIKFMEKKEAESHDPAIYQVPRSTLMVERASGNLLVVFEEWSGNPSGISLVQ